MFAYHTYGKNEQGKAVDDHAWDLAGTIERRPSLSVVDDLEIWSDISESRTASGRGSELQGHVEYGNIS